MWNKFKELETGYKILIIAGFFILLGVLIAIGVDPVDDYASLGK